MSRALSHVFRPLEIGAVTVRNRLMITAHSTNLVVGDPRGYNRWSVLSERAAAYHAERAKGGFGLIIIGMLVVHRSSGTDRPSAFAPELVPATARIADAVHAHGAKLFVQLAHYGRNRTSGSDDWDPVLGASSAPLPFANAHGEMAKPMEAAEIAEVVAGFASAARRLQEAGVDGVEVHAAHGYLLAEFLYSAYNRRRDAYGGSLANRLRFTEEAVDAVRSACGPDFALGVRLDAEWRMPGGMTLDESKQIACRLRDAGRVDFIDASAWPLERAIAPAGQPEAHLVPVIAALKRAVPELPVFAVGRVIDPQTAERILAAGEADMVAMTRASIADPELPNKALAGQLASIRTCVGAGQGCIGRRATISCTQNPAVGREREWGAGTLQPAERPQRVLVVGGGPAGLEVALVAAQRGHQVVLAERERQLGGQIRRIARSRRRGEFLRVVEHRERELARLGVRVELRCEVTPERIEVLRPDTVVLATGSTPRADRWYPPLPHLPCIPGAHAAAVHTCWDVLDGRLDRAQRVLVVDEVGYYQSSDPVEYLIARGCRIDAVTSAAVFAGDLIPIDRPYFLERVRGRPIRFRPFTRVLSLAEGRAVLLETQTGREEILDDLDATVLSLGNAPELALYGRLERAGGAPLHRVGDCLAPRGIEHAIHDAHRLGRSL